MPKNIIALHGFLGQSTDFKSLDLMGLNTINIFNTIIRPMDDWANWFSGIVPENSVLLGYSMGGRLALASLIKRPKKFRAAIIISAHIGLKSHNERKQRWEQDKIWAKKFLKRPFNEIFDEWNNQPTLISSLKPKREKENFNPIDMYMAMRYFSLAKQEDFTDKINELDMPMIFFFPKAEKGKILQLKLKNKKSKIVTIDAGHRLILEKPALLRNEIIEFLKTLD